MIVGIGVDTVAIARIAAALADPRRGQRFRQRLFTSAEIAYCERLRRADQSFAARFAAKEAVIKVLGGLVPPTEIEVVREHAGPWLRLHATAAARADALGIARWHLSLTHTDEVATAFVVAEDAGQISDERPRSNR